MRSHVVSRTSCAEIARGLDLGSRLHETAEGLSREEVERLSDNRNVLAALLEAALAALYLEHGFEPIASAIVEAFEPQIEFALSGHVDNKTELQEQLARVGRSVTYETLNIEGPPHERTFTAAAVVDGEVAGVGTGRSKKDAEQGAAQQALAALI